MQDRSIRSASLLLLGCLVFGCGGGSSQPTGDFGTGLSIDKTTLTFTATASGALPASQIVLATISATDAATMAVGYTAGNPQVDWLLAGILGTVAPAQVTFSMKDTARAVGSYTAHPAIAIFRTDGTPIAVRGMTITYQVTP